MTLNLETLAGVLKRGQEVVRLLRTPNETPGQFAHELANIANDKDKLMALFNAVCALEGHLRVLGQTTIIANGE